MKEITIQHDICADLQVCNPQQGLVTIAATEAAAYV
jgi:hypothetical protein